MIQPMFSEATLVTRHNFWQAFIRLSSESVDAQAAAICDREGLSVIGEVNSGGEPHPAAPRCSGLSATAADRVREAARLDAAAVEHTWKASPDEVPLKIAQNEWREALARVIVAAAVHVPGFSNELVFRYRTLNEAGAVIWRRGAGEPWSVPEVQEAVAAAVPAAQVLFRVMACLYATRSGYSSLFTPPEVAEVLR